MPYPPDYRAGEVRILAGWVMAGISGSVVGPVGCGRTNFLRFLCDHPTAVRSHIPAPLQSFALVPVDLYDLPSENLADLYRTILHAFYWVRERLAPPLAHAAADLYLEHRALTDPFLTQKALYELVLAFEQAQVRVVLVMNRFDRFCEASSPAMLNTLRSLRDRFKETLSYVVGMRQEVAYLPDPAALGAMYELFDGHVCYIGAMGDADSRYVLADALRGAPSAPDAAEAEALLKLSGGFPSLLKAIGQWWLSAGPSAPPEPEWREALLADPAVRYRLERLWQGLTQEEQLALSDIQKQQIAVRRPAASPSADQPTERLYQRPPAVIERLAAKGCCARDGAGWRINGELLEAFVAQRAGRIRGRIWLDTAARVIYQGQQPLDELTPLEFNVLRFLITQPHIRHTSDAIIESVWPPGENKELITPNNLQVHVSSIRKKIEPNPAAPQFLITWHGRPGGYQFFPEGKPQ
jgi:hypothetical protein